MGRGEGWGSTVLTVGQGRVVAAPSLQGGGWLVRRRPREWKAGSAVLAVGGGESGAAPSSALSLQLTAKKLQSPANIQQTFQYAFSH